MALSGLFCADVPLRNYSLTHSSIQLTMKRSYYVQNGTMKSSCRLNV